MNSKLSVKRSVKRAPIRNSVQSYEKPAQTSSQKPLSSGIYAAISTKPVSLEEHNKMIISNTRLAKENAFLKTNLNKYRQNLINTNNNLLDIRQQLSAANNEIKALKNELKNKNMRQNALVSDQLKNTINIIMEDYLAIDCIKDQINRLEGRANTAKGILCTLQTSIEPEGQLNESQSSETINEQLDSIRSSNTSMRLSLTSQEVGMTRRLSSDRIRRDITILAELSTIMEMSTERMSYDLSSDTNNGLNNENERNSDSKDLTTIATTSSSGASNATTKVMSKPTKGRGKAKKETKSKDKTKDETKPKKKSEKTKKIKTEIKESDSSILSIYDFNDEENKENVVPSLPPALPQRCSQRIKSKRCYIEADL